MTDLGFFHHFLGMAILRDDSGLFLFGAVQWVYIGGRLGLELNPNL
jgi:hypothetical protein